MESPQFPTAAQLSTTSSSVPTSNGSSIDTPSTASTDPSFSLSTLLPSASAAAAVKSTPTPPVSPKVVQQQQQHANRLSKLPNIVPVGRDGAAIGARSDSKNEAKNDSSTAPMAGYPAGTASTDAPSSEASPTSTSQKVLGSIATAASAMDSAAQPASNGSPAEGQSQNSASTSSATDPSLLQTSGTPTGGGQFQIIQPLRTEQLSATTPTTPGFSATTPTTPFSPSTPGGTRGKHTCQHCNQTFTRHHNLKSHLLTHSHEKPFLCGVCQARFRRLHDLKRHSKLHTGERPHMCNKCGRKFARGDALARHARAEGGCAGRRSSMAGTSEDGLQMHDGDDIDGLDGLVDDDGDVDMMTPDGNARRKSLPSIRTDFSSTATPITPASSYTYPQLNTPNRTASTAGPSPGNLFPPNIGVKPNTPISASPLQTSTTSVPTPTSTTGNISAISPMGTLTESPQETTPGQDAARSGERHTQFFVNTSQPKHMNTAPTANMATSSKGNPPALDAFWSYIRGLEDRVRSLEKTVLDLQGQLQQVQTAQQLQQEKT